MHLCALILVSLMAASIAEGGSFSAARLPCSFTWYIMRCVTCVVVYVPSCGGGKQALIMSQVARGPVRYDHSQGGRCAPSRCPWMLFFLNGNVGLQQHACRVIACWWAAGTTVYLT